MSDGYKPIDKIFVLLATAVVLAGLVFVLWRAFGLYVASEEQDIVMSVHGVYATIIGVVFSIALGLLLSIIFVRGRKREVRDEEDAARRRDRR